MRIVHGLEADASRQSPRPIRLPNHKAGNRNESREQHEEHGQERVSQLPGFLTLTCEAAGNEDCASQRDGVI